MWFNTLIVLGVLKAVFAVDEMCLKRATRVCITSVVPTNFPNSEAELEKVCHILQNVDQCARNYLQICGVENIDEVIQADIKIQRLLNTTREFCRTDSELHKNLLQNLSCLKEVVDTEAEKQSCPSYTSNAVDILRDQIDKKINAANSGFKPVIPLFNCLVPALNMNCFITRTLHSCGPGAKDIVLQMIIRMGGLEDQCVGPSREDVQELLKILTLKVHETFYVMDLLQRR
ncbi:uncharacterized protein CDAR_427271 [Caerostris darwini]|uniref:Secreted protein n=1 Tax=Caerostris darwini TaxID=1538125 RepID=A0AAV4PNF7_9ARAC|nr:uncharacterized protein CDAR_427271 [Caerostris darwini]